ncbi:MAG: helix-turn-helix transcriptional regulator [Clostridiales bacterium]|jgi:transcriptional regulator with XRE-family HTH domain|nr:helix-turn-helix transcriptional regulator [Clostridiales bacterium]
MAKYNVGSLIRRLRKQRGLTQEELAYPIIDRANLSRIESGKTMPSKKTTEMLFERLGYNPDELTSFYLDDEMSATQKIVDEIDKRLKLLVEDEANPLINEVDELIAQLERNKKHMQTDLNVQHILISKAANALNKKESTEKVREMLVEALKITIPEYSTKYIEDYFLSKQDHRVLNMMAVIYRGEGDVDKALDIWYRLKRNYEKHCICKVEMGRKYPSLALNLASTLYKAQRREEAIEICDKGIESCKDTDFFRHLPVIIYVKAMCLYELGQKEESIKLLRQAYHMSEAMGIEDAVDVVMDFIRQVELAEGIEIGGL